MLIAAAAAAAALLVGGVALVATGGDDDPPRLDLNAAAPASPAAGGGGERMAESVDMASDDMASMLMMARYVAADELPDLGGSAPIHRLVADDDDLRTLARHLGIEGEVTDAEGMQRAISEGDASVSRYGASWWYVSGKAYPGSPDAAVSSGCEGGPDTACAEPSPMPEPERPAGLPTQAEAEGIVRAVAKAAGLDLTNARVTSYDNTTTWAVNIELALDGTPVPGWSVYGTVMEGGQILDAGGAIGSLEQVGDYPLDTTRVAIDRLNEQQTGSGEGATEPAVEPATEPDEMTIMPVVEGEGAEPVTVTLRTAELSYTMAGNADGTETYLVPAYLLDGEDDRGQEWLDVFAIAVRAEFLGA